MPNEHFSLENFPKRGPVAVSNRKFDDCPVNAGLLKSFSNPIRMAIGVSGHKVVRITLVVEKSLRQ